MKKVKKLFKKSKGFTLIELLVSVLIIGILAAIVLPKYQLAIDKATFSKLQIMVKSIRSDCDEYILNFGKMPSNFNNLSLNLPCDFEISDTRALYAYICMSNDNMHCCITNTSNSNAAIYCLKNDFTFGYYEKILTQELDSINKRYCLAKYQNNQHDTRAYKLCQNLANESTDNKTINTPYENSKFGQIVYHRFPF